MVYNIVMISEELKDKRIKCYWKIDNLYDNNYKKQSKYNQKRKNVKVPSVFVDHNKPRKYKNRKELIEDMKKQFSEDKFLMNPSQTNAWETPLKINKETEDKEDK